MKTKILLCLLLTGIWINNVLAQSKVDYVESNTIISNPGRGLQKYSITNNNYNTQTNYTNLNQTTLTNWRTGTDKVTVIFRYFLLDAYLNSDISQTYLNNIQKDFDIIRNAGLKCIVRFSYSNAEGTGPQQPSKAQILTHINQLSPVLTANKDIVLTLQAGFIGTWGEWYYTNSTEFGTDGSINNTQWDNRKQVIDAMLASVPQEIYVQVRYPEIKKKMYGTEKLNSTTAYQNTARARIGFFNDAFLNNWGDMGTFSVNSGAQNPVGTADYTYLANETFYTPMTGETNGMNSPRTTGSNAIYEMDSTNWSCLNRDYHTDVWNAWIASGNYDEILRRLGYRFVLKSSEFSLSGNNLSVNLKLDNKGFARIFNNRKAYLVLQNTVNNTIYKFEFSSDPRTWDKSVVVQQTFDVTSLPNGDYEAYLSLPDNNASIAARAEYAIRFANENVWQESTGYNKLSQQVKKLAIANKLPTVSITSPTNNASFTEPASITINANASDEDGTILKVEFYQGTTKLGEDASTPYSFTWNNVVAGTYSLTAKAYDNSGAVTTSSIVSVVVNAANKVPAVTITSPANNTSYTAPANITINANASDEDGTISKVEFYQGTTKLGEDASTPYSHTWSNVAAGTYSLTAKAYDNSGAVTTSSAVSIVVNAANKVPAVAITSPASNTSYTAPASITINANASDEDGTISKVEFYQGTTKLGEDASSPYSFSWSNIAVGTYSLTAKAYDNSGAVTTSSAVSIVVNAANKVPAVTITSPANNTSYTAPANITINANASDEDGTISKVEFYQGTTKLGEDVSSPYSYTWSNVAAGTYSLTAKAYDNSGSVTTSSAVSITVNPATTGTENCSGIAEWSPTSIYVINNLVTYQGFKYKAKWWTQNENPATRSGQWDVWIKLGECISGTANPVALKLDVKPSKDTTVAINSNLLMNVSGVSLDGYQIEYTIYKDTVKITRIQKSYPEITWDWNALNEGTYQLQVIAKDPNGNAFYPASKVIEVTSTTGIMDSRSTHQMLVIPNPNNGQFNLSLGSTFNSNSNLKVELLNSTGQKVYEGSMDASLEVNLPESVGSGLYILKVTDSNKTYISKVQIY